MGKKQPRTYLVRNGLQIIIAPRRADVTKHARPGALTIPAEAEAIAVDVGA